MTFVLSGTFDGYCGWEFKIIEVCRKFYNKYRRYPNHIRMREKTLDALFNEVALAFKDPYSEEHAVRDSKGNKMVPFQQEEEDEQWEIPEPLELSEEEKMIVEEYLKTVFDYDDDWENYGNMEAESGEIADAVEDECNDYKNSESTRDTIFPVQFGPDENGIVSFMTNKFELKFIEGEDLWEDGFAVQFGNGPDDGGKDYEEEKSEAIPLVIRLAA